MLVQHARRTFYILLVACFTFMVGACSQIQLLNILPEEMFTYVEGNSNLTNMQLSLLEQYEAEPTSASIAVIEINIVALDRGRWVRFRLPNGDWVWLINNTVSPASESLDSPQAFLWYGTNRSKTISVSLVVQEADVLGMINAQTEIYKIRPLGEFRQALILLKTDVISADHPPEWDEVEDQPANTNAVTQPACEAPEISVMVVYTAAAKGKNPYIKMDIEEAVLQANMSYRNSNVKQRLRLVHTYETSYMESGSLPLDESHLKTKGDGQLDDVHTQRDNFDADLVLLWVQSGDYCGKAAGIGVGKEDAFAVVKTSLMNDCSGRYTFAHEIGHLQGARHDPVDDPKTYPFPYGHGYYYEPAQWQTIMSSRCPNVADCNRKDRWSNPQLTFGGVSTGTTCCNNDARVLNETACTIAGFE